MSKRRASRSHDGTAAETSRCLGNEEGADESAERYSINAQSILGNGQRVVPNRESVPSNGSSVPQNGQSVPRSDHRSLTRAQGRFRRCDGCSKNFGGIPTSSHRSPRPSGSIRRELQPHPSEGVGRPSEDVEMLPEQRRKLSGLVGKPETRREKPSSCARVPSVLRRQLSELVELPCVFVSTLAIFEERPSVWGRMLCSFRRMPCAFAAPPWSGPTAARRARRDALEEARAALSESRDALLEPWDAVPRPRNALATRGDALRRRGRDSRRITRSSRTSPRARLISEATVQTRGAAVTTQGEASRARRDAVIARAVSLSAAIEAIKYLCPAFVGVNETPLRLCRQAPTLTSVPEKASYFPYPAATMFAWTLFRVARVAAPVVMTPSYHSPPAASLLSPAVPRTMDPCLTMGT